MECGARSVDQKEVRQAWWNKSGKFMGESKAVGKREWTAEIVAETLH